MTYLGSISNIKMAMLTSIIKVSLIRSKNENKMSSCLDRIIKN